MFKMPFFYPLFIGGFLFFFVFQRLLGLIGDKRACGKRTKGEKSWADQACRSLKILFSYILFNL